MMLLPRFFASSVPAWMVCGRVVKLALAFELSATKLLSATAALRQLSGNFCNGCNFSVPVVGDQGRLRFRISENGLKVTTEWFDKYKMKYILILLCYLTVSYNYLYFIKTF